VISLLEQAPMITSFVPILMLLIGHIDCHIGLDEALPG
jgi:hypothetical protein